LNHLARIKVTKQEQVKATNFNSSIRKNLLGKKRMTLHQNKTPYFGRLFQQEAPKLTKMFL